MLLVYIASPYTLGDTCQNVHDQMVYFNQLINLGYCPYAPLLSHFQQIYFHQRYEVWMQHGLEMVRRSDVVLRLPGDSAGADREVAEARQHKIPVVCSVSELLELPQFDAGDSH